MKLKYFIFLFITIGISYFSDSFAQQKPILYVHNIENLQHNKEEIEKGNKELIQAKERLIKEANKIISKDESYTVIGKKELPPSGDIHDFYSLARYWWPNPKTKDGLPFIRKDGKPYPGRKKSADSEMLSNLGEDAYILGLAYFFTGNETYAKQVKKMIDVFFINKKTKMNPNFEYAQVIRGKGNSDGSIVSANPLMDIVEAIQLTRRSKIWSEQDYQNLQKWYKDFLSWMLNSKAGQRQRHSKNNIGTYYTAQAVTYALFSDQKEIARKIATEDGPRRIVDQINSKGEMKEELKRAAPWNYIKYNLDAFRLLVEVASKLDINLWNYEKDGQGSIEKAYKWIEPYARGEKEWKYGKSKIPTAEFGKFLYSSGFFSGNREYRVSNIYYQRRLENAY